MAHKQLHGYVRYCVGETLWPCGQIQSGGGVTVQQESRFDESKVRRRDPPLIITCTFSVCILAFQKTACNHIWLKREQSARCETWLFKAILICQREGGMGLRKGVGGQGKPEERGVTRRAMKGLFIFVPWTQDESEKGFFPDPLNTRLAKLGNAGTRQCSLSPRTDRERV